MKFSDAWSLFSILRIQKEQAALHGDRAARDKARRDAQEKKITVGEKQRAKSSAIEPPAQPKSEQKAQSAVMLADGKIQERCKDNESNREPEDSEIIDEEKGGRNSTIATFHELSLGVVTEVKENGEKVQIDESAIMNLQSNQDCTDASVDQAKSYEQEPSNTSKSENSSSENNQEINEEHIATNLDDAVGSLSEGVDAVPLSKHEKGAEITSDSQIIAQRNTSVEHDNKERKTESITAETETQETIPVLETHANDGMAIEEEREDLELPVNVEPTNVPDKNELSKSESPKDEAQPPEREPEILADKTTVDAKDSSDPALRNTASDSIEKQAVEKDNFFIDSDDDFSHSSLDSDIEDAELLKLIDNLDSD